MYKNELVDVFTENGTQEPYRVYAIIDDQSNASMISPNLADKLGATGPKLKYLLSTCSGTTEEKSGRRVCKVALRSMAGRTIRLPQLVECSNIPQDKLEIVTPEMAMQFPYLKEDNNRRQKDRRMRKTMETIGFFSGVLLFSVLCLLPEVRAQYG